MPIADVEKDGYLLSTDKSRLDTGFVHDFLSTRSHWAKGVELSTVEKSIANSLCFGLYHVEVEHGDKTRSGSRVSLEQRPMCESCDGVGQGRPAPNKNNEHGDKIKLTQVGFARLITDMTTFAYLSDVFMLESHRGKGIMRWMIQQIVSLPEIHNMRRVVLHSTYAQSFYAQFGFAPVANPQNWMEYKPYGSI